MTSHWQMSGHMVTSIVNINPGKDTANLEVHIDDVQCVDERVQQAQDATEQDPTRPVDKYRRIRIKR